MDRSKGARVRERAHKTSLGIITTPGPHPSPSISSSLVWYWWVLLLQTLKYGGSNCHWNGIEWTEGRQGWTGCVRKKSGSGVGIKR